MSTMETNPWMERLNTVLSVFSRKRKSSSQDWESESSTSLGKNGVQQTQPLSKIMFDERVATFSPITWTARPANPLECARYGWKNTDVNILKCVTCAVVLCGEINSTTNLSTCLEFSRKFRMRLQEAHQDFCPWPTSPSPESFLHLPTKSSDLLLSDLKDVMTTLLALELPLSSLDPAFTLERDVVTWLLENLSFPVSEKSELAVTLALLGWRPVKNVLTCLECNRKLGLWNFQNSNAPGVEEVSQEAPPAKQPKREAKLLNPEAEHHVWCPWVETDKGWKTYLDQLRSHKQNTDSSNQLLTSPKYASMRNGLNNIRKLLDNSKDTEKS